MILKFTANGADESFNERMRAGRIEESPNNLQHWLSRLIQQIYCLFEPFILNECRICFLSCLHRGMSQ
jgi:hypothetical protein